LRDDLAVKGIGVVKRKAEETVGVLRCIRQYAQPEIRERIPSAQIQLAYRVFDGEGTSARRIQTVPDPEILFWGTPHARGSAAHSIPRGSPRMEQADWRCVHPESTGPRIDVKIRLLFRTSAPEEPSRHT
jgi:hypothetical protein